MSLWQPFLGDRTRKETKVPGRYGMCKDHFGVAWISSGPQPVPVVIGLAYNILCGGTSTTAIVLDIVLSPNRQNRYSATHCSHTHCNTQFTFKNMQEGYRYS